LTRPAVFGGDVVQAWLNDHTEWRFEGGHLVRDIKTTDYPSSIQILQAQVALAERLDHHPAVSVGYRHLRFEVWTHDQHGITELDLHYAEGLDEILKVQFGEAVLS
jgi:4a-hydroxytetrahydrobiopterin dehydratase